MRKLLVLIFSFTALSVFAQTNAGQIAPGAMNQFNALLNTPTMVQAPAVTPLGKNWFKMEMDIHVFTNEVNVNQVAAVFLDIGNQAQYFTGKKAIAQSSVVSRGAGETIVDFVSISIAPMGIKIRTPYRASVKEPETTQTKFLQEIRQLDTDSSSNNDIQNLYSARYAETVTINGNAYTYIRMYSIYSANASILPNAKSVLERNTGPANIEAMELLMDGAKSMKN
jgi:hypothetical protein